MPHGDVSYKVCTPENWEEGTEKFYFEPPPDQWPTGPWPHDKVLSIKGPCPRCGHVLEKDITWVVAPALATGGESDNLVLHVECNCTEGHKGAPGLGCGAEGGVEVDLS